MTESPRTTWRARLRDWTHRVLTSPEVRDLITQTRNAAPAVEQEVIDMAKPVVADLTGDTVGHQRLETTVLRALTDDVLAKMDAERSPALPAAPAAQAGATS